MHKKRNRALLLCVLFTLSLLLFTACGNQADQGKDGNITYEVTVVDGQGNPYSGQIMVKFMQNGTQVAMSNVDANGVVSKELPAGDYTLELYTTEADVTCWFDREKAVLSAENHKVEVMMAYAVGGEATTITTTARDSDVSKDYQAYTAGVGCFYVPMTQDDRTYVIFTPTQGGEYQISVDASKAEIGYYGAPHFVQSFTLSEVENGSFTLDISNDSVSTENTGTARYVLGFDAVDGAEGVLLNIVRVGDAPWTIEDEPWVNYKAKREITPYTLPEGITLKAFDLTAPTQAYKLVLNETDRCYHLNTVDGPVVFVQLDKEVYGISLKTMVGENIYDNGVLMQSGSAPFRYMYFNSQEDFFKEDYTDVMREYITNRDQATGVYPMTEDLYYMLTMGIEYIGWCNPESSTYRFVDVPGVNQELTWLFLCMFVDKGQMVLPLPEVPADQQQQTNTNPGIYEEEEEYGEPEYPTNNSGTTTKPIEDNKSAPIEIGSQLEFDAAVQANHVVYYALYRVTDTTLKINSNDAYVIYKGKTYKPVNGVVTVPNLYSANTNVPVKLSIGNMGTSDQTFHVTMEYPIGHKMNPYQLNIGSVSTFSQQDNSQGVYYTFKATKSGTLTIRLDSVTGGNQGEITITSQKIDGGTKAVNLTENANSDGKSLSFQLSAGETVDVSIGILPVNNSYPEATLVTTVSFD